ncbi:MULTISPECIES: hypothetical protein [Bradyrhizobium]
MAAQECVALMPEWNVAAAIVAEQMLGHVQDTANSLASCSELAARSRDRENQRAALHSAVTSQIANSSSFIANKKPPAGHCRRLWRLVHEEV